jgi:Cu2+-containing amine oxidase
VVGNRLSWQKYVDVNLVLSITTVERRLRWDMHIGFNTREGLYLNTVKMCSVLHFALPRDSCFSHQVTYNDGGNVRPLFYRLSLAEMVVPYAVPQWPHPRKFAFDIGEYGLVRKSSTNDAGYEIDGRGIRLARELYQTLLPLVVTVWFVLSCPSAVTALVCCLLRI